MNLKDLITQLVIWIVVAAFPAVWAWLTQLIPWFPFGAEETLQVVLLFVVAAVAWLLSLIGITRIYRTIKAKGLYV